MTNGQYANFYPGYYPSPITGQQQVPQSAVAPQADMLPMFSGPAYGTATVPIGGVREESFIENILRFNKGKIGTFYFTYQGNKEWNAMVYHGRVETAGRDHIIISDVSTGKRYLLLMSNLDWAEFDDRINYPTSYISPEVERNLTSTE